MIKILILHKTAMSNGAYLERFMEKYPILRDDANWKVTVRKFNEKPGTLKKQAFDRLYFDDETVKLEQLTAYAAAAGNPQTFGVNLLPKEKRDKKKNVVRTVHTVTKLKEL